MLRWLLGSVAKPELTMSPVWQAFINTARKIYEKIETGVFDVSNEVRSLPPVHECACCLALLYADLSHGPGLKSCVADHPAVIRHQGWLWSKRHGRREPECCQCSPRQKQPLLRLMGWFFKLHGCVGPVHVTKVDAIKSSATFVGSML